MSEFLQPFKASDPYEIRFIQAILPYLELLGLNHDEFFDGAETAYPLGEALYDLGRDPLVGVITRDVYRRTFFAFHAIMVQPDFEFYLYLFRAIWGDDVIVEFSRPSPGVLFINIQAQAIVLEQWVAREIVGNQYAYTPMVDETDDEIVFQHAEGVRTQSEIDALMREVTPLGIWAKAQLVTT